MWSRRTLRVLTPERPLRFTNDRRKKVLLITLPGAIAQSQTYPFHYLGKQCGNEVLEIGLEAFLRDPSLAPRGASAVCYQTWIDKTELEQVKVAMLVREAYPEAKVVYLDSFAPTDLRFANALCSHVDVYVKKHVLRNRSQYGAPTFGDTNLSDWYGSRYNLTQPRRVFAVPNSFFSKLVVGPSFFTAPYMLTSFAHGKLVSPTRRRSLDIHVRLGGSDHDNWYGRMRCEAIAAAISLRDANITETQLVGKLRYLLELSDSKLCFSPFGYGEVCWRDYESAYSGCLLIKPDMSHIETIPDIFTSSRTYVPVAWDFSDLAEKSKYYLTHDTERIRIANTAMECLNEFSASNALAEWTRRLFQ